MNIIFQRRSIRKYTPERIPDDAVRSILAAGMNAPSAGNQQPWQFIIVTDRQRIDGLSHVSPHSNMLRDAPAAIVVCGDLSVETHKGFWVQDCAAATENMLLQITELRLGAVWIGVYPRDDRVDFIRRMFQLPEHIVPFAIVSMGHPAESKPAVDRYREERVHRETW